MRWLRSILLFCFFLPVSSFAGDLPETQKLDLYLLVGQSNMAGRGKIEPQDQVVNPHIWKLDKEDHWVPSIDPLHFDKPNVAGVGLGSSFARVLAEKYPDHFIGLVPCAVGGTRIDQWAKGSELYNEAVRRCRIAETHGKLCGILWHQGESDSIQSRVPTYMEHLKLIVGGFRNDLDVPDAPLIVGQVGAFHIPKAPFTKDMNDVLAKVADSIPNSACASSEGLTDLGDATHFNAPSLREFGKRYAAEFLRIAAPATQPATHP